MWTLTRRTNKLSYEYHRNSLGDIKLALGITTPIEQRHCPLWGNLSMIEFEAKLNAYTVDFKCLDFAISMAIAE